MEAKRKAVLVGTAIPTALAPPLLELADLELAARSVAAGTDACPETYPMYLRPGVMVPTIAGAIMLAVGLLADKPLEKYPEVQEALLVGGSNMLAGGAANISQALYARYAVGAPMFMPDRSKVYGDTNRFVPRASGYKRAPRASDDAHPPTPIGEPAAAAPAPAAAPTDVTPEVKEAEYAYAGV